MKTEVSSRTYNLEQLRKSYQADQQVKYMSLDMELELLLQQIKTKKKG